jgi:hypothetical protein
MPRDSNCDYLAFVVWVETKAALREMIPDHASNMLTLIQSMHYLATIRSPKVQRIERRFPKTKPMFYHTSSAIVSTTQIAFC